MLSIPHLVVLFTVALMVFGPHKLPELARNLGKIVAEFRRMSAEMRGTFDQHMRELERETELLELKKAEFARAVSAANAGAPMPVAEAAAAAAGVVVEGATPETVSENPTENSIGDFPAARLGDTSATPVAGTVAGERPTAAPETIPEPSATLETRELFPDNEAPQSGELFPENNTNGSAPTPDSTEKLSQPKASNEEDVHTS
ncbi:MAG: twin-arginine translocase TatA/TatE family subunit [Candidatus Acidiferrales bacterium]